MTSSSDRPKLKGVELVQDVSRLSSPVDGFLRRHRHRVKTTFDDGSRTETYLVDYADRVVERREAVVVVVYAKGPTPEETLLLLRSQLRYPVYVVEGRPCFLELIAGVLEHPESVAACVVRELAEEAGIDVDEGMVVPLGPAFYPLPAAFTERLHLAAVELPVETIRAVVGSSPDGDGSPFEEGAELIALTMGEALRIIDQGLQQPHRLDDAKTELGLRRLLARLSTA
jgi:8-oxo-dGTP pyrophosphatase MutT (NUDIX family)